MPNSGHKGNRVKEIYYAGVWASNVNFGSGPNGQDLASIEIDYYAGITPTLGKWNFDIAAYYVTYPGAFNPGGEFDYVEIWTGVNRSFFNDRLTLTIYNYWAPEYFGETGNNDVLEFSYEWTFNKIGNFTPKLGGNVGHQWGDLGQGGYDYTYWSVALTLGFNENPPFELEVRYWNSVDFNGHLPVLGRGRMPESCRGISQGDILDFPKLDFPKATFLPRGPLASSSHQVAVCDAAAMSAKDSTRQVGAEAGEKASRQDTRA